MLDIDPVLPGYASSPLFDELVGIFGDHNRVGIESFGWDVGDVRDRVDACDRYGGYRFPIVTGFKDAAFIREQAYTLLSSKAKACMLDVFGELEEHLDEDHTATCGDVPFVVVEVLCVPIQDLDGEHN